MSTKIVMSAAVERGLRESCVAFAQGVIIELSEKNGLSIGLSEAMDLINWGDVSVVSKRSAAMTKVRVSSKSLSSSKPSMTIPFCGVVVEGWCQGIRLNHGLHTQCMNGKLDGSDYCKTCVKTAENSASNKPTYGDIRDRLEGNLLEYRDPTGRMTTCFANVAQKRNLDIEQAQAAAKSFGWEIPEDQLVVKVTKRGRPSTGKKKVKKVVKSSEESTMEDQISKLVAEAANDVLSESTSIKKVVRVKKALKTEKLLAAKAAKAEKAESVASAKSEKAEKLLAARALKVEKAAAAKALKVEKAAAAKALKVEKAAATKALKVEKAAAAKALKVEKAAAAKALKTEKLLAVKAEKAESVASAKSEKAEKLLAAKALKTEKLLAAKELKTEKLLAAKLAKKVASDALKAEKVAAKLAEKAAKKVASDALKAEKVAAKLAAKVAKKVASDALKAEKVAAKASKKVAAETSEAVDEEVTELTSESIEKLQIEISKENDEEDDEEDELVLDDSTPTIEIDGITYFRTDAYGLGPNVLFTMEGEPTGLYEEETGEIQELEFE
jgi:hypothetical protein